MITSIDIFAKKKLSLDDFQKSIIKQAILGHSIL